MKFRPTLLALGLGVIAFAANLAATAEDTAAEGNAERGKTLAYTCHGCHGIPSYKNAYPSYSVPRLGGQHAKYLELALVEYSSGDRPHQTMHAQAATMSSQDRADIAAYLQSEVVQPGTEVIGTPPPATTTCVACHGADGAKTLTEEHPILAGQYADYIVQALRDYKSGKRKNPIMAGIITGVNEKDFASIAQFFSQQRGLCTTDQIRKRDKCDKQ